MPCDNPVRLNQSLQERKDEVRRAVERLDRALLRKQVKVKVGPQGAVTFEGWQDRGGVTDACAYRRIMMTGTALAKAEIARAEMMAGRSVDRRTVAAGVHSHDGGATWHGKG